jgi:aspartyl-tRNA(Asn)/glutamyl-tRNA(Gln) amidotransferase subunit B
LRVAIALECEIFPTSIFARKNYFYPDLPKGYQISQYEQPLARNGKLTIRTSQGEKVIRIRRVHLEEDTGKSVHVDDSANKKGSDSTNQQSGISNLQPPISGYSLIDLNRSGIPLLEIVTEPDLHSPEEVSAYARALRDLLRYLDVNSGDLQKGVLRIEPNISIRPVGISLLGTRTEVKNLNSFRALERAVEYEINRQIEILESGGEVMQETVGWDETQQVTVSQRSKEEAHDYRYFPDPDLPPLVVEQDWVDSIRANLPERPYDRFKRFILQYGLREYDADVLTADRATADYFENTLAAAVDISPKTAANWIIGDLFGLLNEAGKMIGETHPTPAELGNLLQMIGNGSLTPTSAKRVLSEMFISGKSPEEIVNVRGLRQILDKDFINQLVDEVLAQNADQVEIFLAGKETVFNWLFGQVMRRADGRANPEVLRELLTQRLREPQHYE